MVEIIEQERLRMIAEKCDAILEFVQNQDLSDPAIAEIRRQALEIKQLL